MEITANLKLLENINALYIHKFCSRMCLKKKKKNKKLTYML